MRQSYLQQRSGSNLSRIDNSSATSFCSGTFEISQNFSFYLIRGLVAQGIIRLCVLS